MKITIRAAIVLLGLVLVYNGCKNEVEIKTSTPPWLRVYFSPQDDIPAVIISLVSSARYQVWAAFYSMDHPGVAAALLAAADRGKRRAILHRAAELLAEEEGTRRSG